MKTKHFVAAMAAFLSFAGVAYAAPAPVDASTGHYEWRQTPSYGPRAPLAAPRRVWVSDSPQMANCTCDMMQMSAVDCMKAMPGMDSPAGSAG
jgi:hypothetical protein